MLITFFLLISGAIAAPSFMVLFRDDEERRHIALIFTGLAILSIYIVFFPLDSKSAIIVYFFGLTIAIMATTVVFMLAAPKRFMFATSKRSTAILCYIFGGIALAVYSGMSLPFEYSNLLGRRVSVILSSLPFSYAIVRGSSGYVGIEFFIPIIAKIILASVGLGYIAMMTIASVRRYKIGKICRQLGAQTIRGDGESVGSAEWGMLGAKELDSGIKQKDLDFRKEIGGTKIGYMPNRQKLCGKAAGVCAIISYICMLFGLKLVYNKAVLGYDNVSFGIDFWDRFFYLKNSFIVPIILSVVFGYAAYLCIAVSAHFVDEYNKAVGVYFRSRGVEVDARRFLIPYMRKTAIRRALLIWTLIIAMIGASTVALAQIYIGNAKVKERNSQKVATTQKDE